MAGWVTSFANTVLDWIVGRTLYLALSTGAQVAMDGTVTNEVAAGKGYSRVAINFAGASSAEVLNNAIMDYGVATADWGTISHFAICTGTSGANAIVHGSFTSAKAVATGQTAQVRDGEISISLE